MAGRPLAERARGRTADARAAGPALQAAERTFDRLRRTYKALERQQPGAGEGLAARAAEALEKINSDFQVSDPHPRS